MPPRFNPRKSKLALAIGLSTSLLLVGCGGVDDETTLATNDTTIPTNTASETGLLSSARAIVSQRDVASTAECSAGGVEIEAGNDTNGNNVLDAAEVARKWVVCHGDKGDTGAAGATGESSHFEISALSAGSTCPAGGQTVTIGIKEGNGFKAGTTQAVNICNGVNGSDGTAAVDGLPAKIAQGKALVNSTKTMFDDLFSTDLRTAYEGYIATMDEGVTGDAQVHYELMAVTLASAMQDLARTDGLSDSVWQENIKDLNKENATVSGFTRTATADSVTVSYAVKSDGIDYTVAMSLSYTLSSDTNKTETISLDSFSVVGGGLTLTKADNHTIQVVTVVDASQSSSIRELFQTDPDTDMTALALNEDSGLSLTLEGLKLQDTLGGVLEMGLSAAFSVTESDFNLDGQTYAKVALRSLSLNGALSKDGQPGVKLGAYVDFVTENKGLNFGDLAIEQKEQALEAALSEQLIQPTIEQLKENPNNVSQITGYRVRLDFTPMLDEVKAIYPEFDEKSIDYFEQSLEYTYKLAPDAYDAIDNQSKQIVSTQQYQRIVDGVARTESYSDDTYSAEVFDLEYVKNAVSQRYQFSWSWEELEYSDAAIRIEYNRTFKVDNNLAFIYWGGGHAEVGLSDVVQFKTAQVWLQSAIYKHSYLGVHVADYTEQYKDKELQQVSGQLRLDLVHGDTPISLVQAQDGTHTLDGSYQKLTAYLDLMLERETYCGYYYYNQCNYTYTDTNIAFNSQTAQLNITDNQGAMMTVQFQPALMGQAYSGVVSVNGVNIGRLIETQNSLPAVEFADYTIMELIQP